MTDTYKPRFMNGGDEPSGDASTRKDEDGEVGFGSPSFSSPTYTREELVEVIALSIAGYSKCETAGRHDIKRAEGIIDALIAIGAVRVK